MADSILVCEVRCRVIIIRDLYTHHQSCLIPSTIDVKF